LAQLVDEFVPEVAKVAVAHQYHLIRRADLGQDCVDDLGNVIINL
jgi:hypothetical protein